MVSHGSMTGEFDDSKDGGIRMNVNYELTQP